MEITRKHQHALKWKEIRVDINSETFHGYDTVSILMLPCNSITKNNLPNSDRHKRTFKRK